MDTKELGSLGETLACEYLVGKGYKVLERNYRVALGEIDIIARKKFTLLNKILQILTFAFGQKLFNGVNFFSSATRPIHFVEVKTIVASDGFFPQDRVDYKKQHKLRQLAQIWLQHHKLSQNYPCQIDVIGIVIDSQSQKPTVHYFQNVVADAN